jgi:hypothetical protein
MNGFLSWKKFSLLTFFVLDIYTNILSELFDILKRFAGSCAGSFVTFIVELFHIAFKAVE